MENNEEKVLYKGEEMTPQEFVERMEIDTKKKERNAESIARQKLEKKQEEAERRKAFADAIIPTEEDKVEDDYGPGSDQQEEPTDMSMYQVNMPFDIQQAPVQQFQSLEIPQVQEARLGGLMSLMNDSKIDSFKKGGMKTSKSKDGTITNTFRNKDGNTVVQVKTKDGKYFEKIIPIEQQKSWNELGKKLIIPQQKIPKNMSEAQGMMDSGELYYETYAERKARNIREAKEREQARIKSINDHQKRLNDPNYNLFTGLPGEDFREYSANEAGALGARFRASMKDNFFDDYLNPFAMVGSMAQALGEAPKKAKETNSYLPYVLSIGAPLAVGAFAGFKVKNNKQFINNLANPLAGIKTPNINKPTQLIAPNSWAIEELPGLHLKSTMSNGPISKIIEPKTGLINVEQALGIIGKESGGADKVALIKQGLGETIPKKMDYNEFRKVVQDQLIPLERQFATDSSKYGIDRLGYSNIEHWWYENGVRKSNINDVPLENQTLILGNKSKFGRGSSAHGNPDETLGHIHFLRDAETPDVLTVTQIQSDAFQGTHRVMPKNTPNATGLEREKKSLQRMEELQNRNKSILNKMKTEGVDDAGLPVQDYQIKQFEDIVKAQEQANLFKKAGVENFTQKSLLDKNHQERYLQELVNYAGERGDINKIRVPASETAAKIQNYKKSIPTHLDDNLQPVGGGEYSSKHQTILKKYAEQPKLIKKLFGAEPKVVTDSKGNTWYEFDIPEKFKGTKGEIKAFSMGGMITNSSSITGEEIIQEKQNGGYIETELTPEEIEEYRKGGYIVEDISIPELNQAKDGGNIKTHKSKDGTITNTITKPNGDVVVQVKTKNGKYYEKVIRPEDTRKTLGALQQAVSPEFKTLSYQEPSLEERVNYNLGNPQGRAEEKSEKYDKDHEPIDNVRHPFAGRYAAESLYKMRKRDTPWAPDWMNKGAAWLDANMLGVAHELGVITKDDRPWSIKLRESAEDIYNNNVGVNVGLSKKTPKQKDNELVYKALNHKIPDGMGEKRPFDGGRNPWTDPYDKKRDGGLFSRLMSDNNISTYKKSKKK